MTETDVPPESPVDPLPPVEWTTPHPLERRPQALDGADVPGLANHVITISFSPGGKPMVVVRGNTAAEIILHLDELENEGVYPAIMAAQATMISQGNPAFAEGLLKERLGATEIGTFPAAAPQAPPQPYAPGGWPPGATPAPPVPQQAPVPSQQVYPVGVPAPSAGPPPFGGPPMPAGAGMPAPQWGQPAPVRSVLPPGFTHRLSVPFQKMDAWKAFRTGPMALAFQGQTSNFMKWDKETKTWMLTPTMLQWLGQQPAAGQFGVPYPDTPQ